MKQGRSAQAQKASDAQEASQPFRQRDIANRVSPRESNPDRLSLCLRGDGAIGQAVDAARALGMGHGLEKDDLARLCIVVEELVANLYDHGGVTPEDDVQLSIAGDPNGIRISIVDPGVPFNPWATVPAIGTVERGANAGLSLVRAWAELVDYRRSGDRNHLELLLPARR